MPNITTLRRQFSELPNEVKNHFSKLSPFLANSDLEVALAYCFMLVEQGRYRAVKCLLVRNLRCSGTLVDSMYQTHEFQRKSFRKTISDLADVDLSVEPYSVLEAAETIRDGLLHGRPPNAERMRQGIEHALTFVRHFGSLIEEKTGKNPFGDLRGLSSRMAMLPNDQARWIIKGVQSSSVAR